MQGRQGRRGGSNLPVGDAGSRSACRRRQPSKRRCRRRPASGNRTPTPTGSCASRRAQPAGQNGRRMPEDDLLGHRAKHRYAQQDADGEVGEDPVAQRLHVRALLEAHLGRQRDHASWLSAHFPLASDRSSGRRPQVLSSHLAKIWRSSARKLAYARVALGCRGEIVLSPFLQNRSNDCCRTKI